VLTSKERVRKALNHEPPDRVPIDLGGLQSGIHITAYEKLLRYLGIQSTSEILDINQQIVKVDERILKKFEIDTRYIHLNEYNPNSIRIEGKHSGEFYTDRRGVVWRKPKEGYYFDLYKSPLKNATSKDLKEYPWYKVYDAVNFDGLAEKTKHLYDKTDFALVTNFQGILEGSWELRGIEKFFMDIAGNKEFVEELLDNVLEVKKKVYGDFLDITGKSLDLVKISDDLGTQTGLLFSPQFYRDVVKPRHKELVNFIKSKTKAKVAIHTDGGILPLLNDLIEIGFDVINPVQISVYGISARELKKVFGKKISFWGAVDTQRLLPFGRAHEVKETVKKLIDDLASEGGYILASCHNIQAEVSPENICALFEAAIEYQ
jgi:uroporphyrinogen decarboxylase